MAAWRGKQAWTWITGMVTFAAPVVECFDTPGGLQARDQD
jgi:hypothetical protein